MNTCKPIMSLGELAVILCPKAKQEELLTALKERAIVSSPKQLLIVQKDWPLFPYLKTKDQVLLTLSENKKERKTQINDMLTEARARRHAQYRSAEAKRERREHRHADR